MRFSLRAIFVLVTVVAVLAAYFVMTQQRRAAFDRHLRTFDEVAREIGMLDAKIRKRFVALPTVAEALSKLNVPVPENYISGGFGGTRSSLPGGNARFSFTSQLQLPTSGDDFSSMKLVLEGQIDYSGRWRSFGKHAVEIRYQDTNENRDIAKFLENELKKKHSVTVNHHVQ